MITELRIRKATKRDIPRITYLEKSSINQFYSTGTSHLDIVQYLKRETILLAFNQNNIVGKISYKRQAAKVSISGLIVLPNFRGRGYGQFLSRYVVDLFPTIKSFLLTVHPQNIPAQNIYHKLGFESKEIIQNYYGDNEPRLIMELKR